MEISKHALDVGLFVDGDLEPILEHWQSLDGISFDEMLPTGGGVRQHRHRLGDSIIKINHAREALKPQPASGYRRLLVATDDVVVETPVPDPRGHDICLVPRGDVEQLRLVVQSDDVTAQVQFYDNVLQLDRLAERVFACGVSQIEIVEGPSTASHPMRAPGFRYITIQVFDVVGEHAGIRERGGREGRPPVRLGDVAYISFVQDPGGNWIEISQRKSLTGTLD